MSSAHHRPVFTCVTLFAIALCDRFLFALRSIIDKELLRQRNAQYEQCGPESLEMSLVADREDNAENSEDQRLLSATSNCLVYQRHPPPFMASYDFAHAALFAAQATLGYALMLGAMSSPVLTSTSAAYLISILVGLGVGEIVFGRFGSGSSSICV
ncbi:hypothetical protein FA95DRAFT_1557320 [Auriscalpium vulgare]|uniref:Uncharacterized protein n=1 Tax=Auriscalpium vulgare TaxID=40419 RepID=A0ACB8RYA9_9AGAM|nr:hypothetical protein FA95DRAFT_1557320 [Auriscalpium vulgare]